MNTPTPYHFKPGAWKRLPLKLRERYWRETNYGAGQPDEKLRYELDVASDWHYSHNVSDTMFVCYGCHMEAGDKRLYEPCPTPDEVGQALIKAHEEKRRKLGIV